VPDRGHSAKKRNKPPRRTFLLPSLISLSHCHPHAAVDSLPRRSPAAAPAPHRHRRAHPLTRAPCSPSPLSRRARLHRRRARRARAHYARRARACRAHRARRARARRARSRARRAPHPRPPRSPCPSPAPAALAVPAPASSCPSPPPPGHAYHRRPHARYTLFMRQFTM
jgi:hypothetical protein